MAGEGVQIVVDANALRRELRRIGDAGLKKELAAANKSAADVVIVDAGPKIPVRTGRLRKSVRATGSQRVGQAKAGSAAVPYAAAIHWGRKKRGVIEGRPFLTDAAEHARTRVVDVYQRAVDRLLSKLR